MTMHIDREGYHLYHHPGPRTEDSHLISLSHSHPPALIYGPFSRVAHHADAKIISSALFLRSSVINQLQPSNKSISKLNTV